MFKFLVNQPIKNAQKKWKIKLTWKKIDIELKVWKKVREGKANSTSMNYTALTRTMIYKTVVVSSAQYTTFVLYTIIWKSKPSKHTRYIIHVLYRYYKFFILKIMFFKNNVIIYLCFFITILLVSIYLLLPMFHLTFSSTVINSVASVACIEFMLW